MRIGCSVCILSLPTLALIKTVVLTNGRATMTSGDGTCTIKFDDPAEKAKACFELVHSRANFSGMGKDVLVIRKSDCDFLKSKDIKYKHLD